MKIEFKSFVKDISKDMDKAESRLRSKAARHLVKKMKSKIKGTVSQPGQPPGKVSGNLIKGIGYQNENANHITRVGVKPPAYYAHMLEFGTAERYVKIKGSNKKRSVGRVAPRPFVLPTFEEEKEAVKEILNEKWF